MQSSASSSSPSQEKIKQNTTGAASDRPRWWIALPVWMLRILVGGTFVVSGLSKAIDVWGGMYKIQEYLTVWGLDIPASLTLAASVCLSIWEALLGSMLLLGCYRRSSSWLLLATMLFMLPLSIYIYLVDPVADCGCFGDFIILSNSMTMYKNIALTLMLLFLAVYNKRVVGLISPYIQWMSGFAVLVYLIAVCLVGYNIQPMIDFRGYPEGTKLATSDNSEQNEDEEDVVFEFIYEKDGEKKSFSADSLPDDSWTYVDRRLVSGSIDESRTFIVYDNGEDVTDSAITGNGKQMLVLIPDLKEADITFTFYLNELYRYMKSHDGSLVGVVATGDDDEALEHWREMSLAEYPLYTAEATAIKELARGSLALVYLENGEIKWKRTASSLDGELLIDSLGKESLMKWHFDGSSLLRMMTMGLLLVLIVILFANNSFRAARLFYKLSRRNKVGNDSADKNDNILQ